MSLRCYPPGLGRSRIDCAPSWVVKCGIGTRAAHGLILFTSADTGRLTIHSASRSTFPMGIVCQGAETPSIKQTMTVILESPTKDRKSTRLNSSHLGISYAVFCLKKKKQE